MFSFIPLDSCHLFMYLSCADCLRVYNIHMYIHRHIQTYIRMYMNTYIRMYKKVLVCLCVRVQRANVHWSFVVSVCFTLGGAHGVVCMCMYACTDTFANVSVLIDWSGTNHVFSVCGKRARESERQREFVCISNLPQP